MAETTNPGARDGATGTRGRLARAGEPENSRRRGRATSRFRIEGQGTLDLAGRLAWALRRLIEAGPRGCTPISDPGPRWSDYVRKLRLAGIEIETAFERHGPPFAGTHGRYVLRQTITVEGGE